jgi:uncharacterized membrane protein
MRLRQPHREIKYEARQILLQNARICLAITLVAGLFYFAVLFVQSYYAVGIVLEFSDPLKNSAQSAFSFGKDGLSLILRLEDIRLVAKVSATLPQLVSIAIMQLFSVVLTAPAIFGARALLCRIAEGKKIETADLKGIFRWYTDLSLAGKAILLYGMLSLLEWASYLLSAGISLYYFFSLTVSGSAGKLPAFAVFFTSLCVLLLGLLLAWSILPAGWILARQPELGPFAALGRCRELMRGWTADHYLFRLSFILWYICTLLTYNALLIFLFPYYQIAETCYLRRLQPERTDLFPLL